MTTSQEKTYEPLKIPENSSGFYLLYLKVIDIAISSAIIGPCVIAYWRGTWAIMDHTLLPQHPNISVVTSFAIGCFGNVFFIMYQDTFKKTFDPDKRRLTYYVGSRIYTVILGLVNVNMWRGVWQLCDYLTSATLLKVIVPTTAIAICGLVLVKGSRNLVAPPFVNTTDHRNTYFTIYTLFGTAKYHRPRLYFLDAFFSAIVVGTLVVIGWRGVWVTLDLTFYPKDPIFSALGSLIIGYGIVGVLFLLQPILQRAFKDVEGTKKLVLADCYYLTNFFGAVNVWRGVWILLDVYLYPENQLKSCYVSHVISFVVLTVLNCANSILVRGAAVDGQEIDSSWAELPISYVQVHLQKKRARKYLDGSRKYEPNESKSAKEQDLLMSTS